MTTQVLTPQERIERMRAAVAEKAAREKAEKDRSDRRLRLESAESERLRDQLKVLDGLPVTPNGTVKVERNWLESGGALVSVFRRGWEEIDGENETVMEALFEIVVVADHDGRAASLTHDDEVVTPDVALDMATAIVESRFAV